MGTENTNPSEFPNTTKHVGEDVVDYLNDTLGPRVSGDEDRLIDNAINKAKRRLNTRRTDTLNELAASDEEGADLVDYANEIKDPEIDKAVEENKRTNVEIYMDAKELPPPQD